MGWIIPKSFVDWFLNVILLITVTSVLVPWSPIMPAPGLDPSWALGLNQAVAQGFSFGKEIIFTLGPYSSIYTKVYHPSTDWMMVGGSLYLAFSYWVCIIFLMKGIPWRWVVAFCILLFSMIYARDSLLFSYPLLVGLVSYKIIFLKNKTLEGNKSSLFLFAFIVAPLGLLTLIKGSLLILSVVMVALCAVFFTASRKKGFALVCLTSPLVTLLFFWIGAGQHVGHLPSYFISTVSLSSEFSEAMATDANLAEMMLYLMATAVLLLAIVWQKQVPKVSRLFLFSVFFVFLFLSFKAGFSRYYGHAFIPGSSILIAALLLPFIFDAKVLFPVIFLAWVTWADIEAHYTNISLYNNAISTFSSAWYGLKNRVTDENHLKQDFDITMNFIREQANFPVLHGTTDIYSYNQSYLISSGYEWSPRPVFQSYSVFASRQAQDNKQHLLGEHRPNNIIFKVEPIDGRIPSLEDGVSWPVLMKNYQLSQQRNDFLFLKQKTIQNETQTFTQSLLIETHRFGDVVNVPNSTSFLFVELEIKPTIWGRFVNALFKSSPLSMTLQLKNGTIKQYRILANMAKSGFLISPLIENTAEFALLFGEKKHLDSKRVMSFVMSSSQGNTGQWHDEYVTHFKYVR